LLKNLTKAVNLEPGDDAEDFMNKFAILGIQITNVNLEAANTRYKAFQQNYRDMTKIFYRRFRSENKLF
jgi:hypothetical protein